MNATILLYPLAVLLSLIHLGINICLFFLIIRWIQTWKEVGWLSGLDRLGRPLTGATLLLRRLHSLLKLTVLFFRLTLDPPYVLL